MARFAYVFFLSLALLIEQAVTCEDGDCDVPDVPADYMSLLQVGLEHTSLVSSHRGATADALAAKACSGSGVLIVGATSPVGKMLYKMLKGEGSCVRAVARSAEHAKKELGCTKCDASEGIYIADVTEQNPLSEAGRNVSTLVMLESAHAICEGTEGGFPDLPGNCHYSPGAYPKDVDWLGGVNQLRSFSEANKGQPIHVIRLSEMGTTRPSNPPDLLDDGWHIFYNLNFEAFLMASGVPYTILKTCKTDDSPPAKRQLYVGNHDELFWKFRDELGDDRPLLSRSDIAVILFEALKHPDLVVNLRTDMCSTGKRESGPQDWAKFFQDARASWR